MKNVLPAIIIFTLSLSPVMSVGQYRISGSFPAHAGQQVQLMGFEGFGTYPIATTKADHKGRFELNYTRNDWGMGYVVGEDEKPFIVILSGEDIDLKGEALGYSATIEILAGHENQLFEQYASEHPRREQALSAWDYLERIYTSDSLFVHVQDARAAIKAEKHRIGQQDQAFLENLDPDTYVSWFLPVRKLVSSVPTIAQYRTAEIPAAIAAFRNMDYTDPRLYKSGLLRETIEAHFWLIENSGRALDSVFMEMNVSIDRMIENLVADTQKLNQMMDYLFNLLERRSLFASSEHLALKLLNEVSVPVDEKLARQLESYRALKTGNTAPNIVFAGDLFKNGQAMQNPGRLSEIKAGHIVLVFGSAGCPMCSEELLAILRVYDKWKSQGVEVVYVSLDESKEEFSEYLSGLPFYSFSDYRQWESPAAKDYHIIATPTMFLLDHNLEILLRPNSAKHMDSWVDWFLVQGN